MGNSEEPSYAHPLPSPINLRPPKVVLLPQKVNWQVSWGLTTRPILSKTGSGKSLVTYSRPKWLIPVGTLPRSVSGSHLRVAQFALHLWYSQKWVFRANKGKENLIFRWKTMEIYPNSTHAPSWRRKLSVRGRGGEWGRNTGPPFLGHCKRNAKQVYVLIKKIMCCPIWCLRCAPTEMSSHAVRRMGFWGVDKMTKAVRSNQPPSENIDAAAFLY